MGVGVDDHDLDVRLLVLEIADGDGDIIEDAVALAVFTEGMVGASGETDTNALGQGDETSLSGRLDLDRAAGEKLRPHGQAEQHLLLAAEGGGLDFRDVVGLVRELQQVGIRHRADVDDLLRPQDSAVEQHVLRHAELVHRERMSGGQFEFEILGIKAAHRRAEANRGTPGKPMEIWPDRSGCEKLRSVAHWRDLLDHALGVGGGSRVDHLGL